MVDPLVRIVGLKKAFGKTLVLDGVDIDVGKGEVVVIIGPSGSGKTTLLRCINLLETYDAGSIKVDGTRGRLSTMGPADAAASANSRSSAPISAWYSRCSICFPI